MSPAFPRRARRVATRLALALASSVVALGLAEVGLRVALRVRGTPYDPAEARKYLDEIENRNAKALPLPGRAKGGNDDERVSSVQHPYIGWEADFYARNLSHDLERFATKPPDLVRVLVLGGSVAAIFHQYGCPKLAELLQQDPALAGKKLQFVCYARGAYKQPQELQYLALLLSLGVVPDAVLLIDGFNEVAIGNSNFERGMHPAWPSYAQWLPLVTSTLDAPQLVLLRGEVLLLQQRTVASCARGLSGPLWSALFGEWSIHRARGIEAQLRERSERFSDLLTHQALGGLRGPKLPGSSEAAVQFAVRHWRECSRLMQALCAARGVRFLHVLQPTLHDPGAKPITPEEQAKGSATPAWIAGVEQGYPLLRQAGRSLADEGIAFLDASRVFERVEETLYYDACHFAERGNELLAEAIAPAFAALFAKEPPR